MNLNSSSKPDVPQTVPKRCDSAFRTECYLQLNRPSLAAACGDWRQIGSSAYDGGGTAVPCRGDAHIGLSHVRLDDGVRVLAQAVLGRCLVGRAYSTFCEHCRKNDNDR